MEGAGGWSEGERGRERAEERGERRGGESGAPPSQTGVSVDLSRIRILWQSGSTDM